MFQKEVAMRICADHGQNRDIICFNFKHIMRQITCFTVPLRCLVR
jgi:16S rRNA A1518/A1519 N6-dimethyltransferase RsmA/KsgA/DIM1 with predicted DNA glycosylase/AP lyase activity